MNYISANNFILIEWNGGEREYSITHRDYDSLYVMDKLGSFKTLEEAVEKANKFKLKMEKEGMGIEYGLEIILKSVKKLT